jgi:hypothetical protein
MTNQNITQISGLENLIDESKAFLKTIKKQASSPVRIVIRTLDGQGNDHHTLLYEENAYILIAPRGDLQHARIYGTWEDALYASKQLFARKLGLQEAVEVSIGQDLYSLPQKGI